VPFCVYLLDALVVGDEAIEPRGLPFLWGSPLSLYLLL
jgi:hypothetical protein